MSGEVTLSQPEEESISPPGTVPVGVAETTDHAANHAMRWWILAVLGVAQLMVILDNTVRLCLVQRFIRQFTLLPPCFDEGPCGTVIFDIMYAVFWP